MDRPFEMDRFIVEILGFVVRELSGEGGYQYPEQVIDMPDILRLAKQWVRKGERSVEDKYLPRTDSPFGKAQNNSR